MTARPNILLITADQWRGDCLSILGHPQIHTPNLDKLARESVIFTNHHTPCVPCSPARASLYTGLHHKFHGVTYNGAPLDNGFDNIARAGRRAGYVPTLFGYSDTALDPRVLHPNDPDAHGYENILPGFFPRVILREDDKSWLSWLISRGVDIGDPTTIHHVEPEEGERISLNAPRYTRDQTQTAFLTDEFLRWHWEQDGAWFAHISYLRPHPPFVVPEPFNRMFDPEGGPQFERSDRTNGEDVDEYNMKSQDLADFIPNAAGQVGDLSNRDFRRIRALYYGMIAEVDTQLGRLFDTLRTRDAFENTVIIFTSDHGEMMGDYGILGKGSAHRQSYHIPLIIKKSHNREQAHIHVPTASTDIFPTLCRYMRAKPDNWINGRALTPFLDKSSNPAKHHAPFV